MSPSECISEKAEQPATWPSVVMPVRKGRATAARSLDALMQQKILGPCEIIFVCDKPDDDFLDVIRNHSLLKVWHHVEIFHLGRGLAQAYNPNPDWRAARTKYVFNMYSDYCSAKDGAMIRRVEWLEREDSLAVEPLNDSPQGDWETMSFWDRVTSAQFRNAKPGHALMGKFDLIRRNALERLVGFDKERFWSTTEDADMVVRFTAIGEISCSDVVVIHAHQRDTQRGREQLTRLVESGTPPWLK